MSDHATTGRDIAGEVERWSFPDSDVAAAALRLVYEVSSPVLANHCIRSYLFGREHAASRGLRGGVDYDEELVFLSCVLHDLGLTAYGSADQRFEVDGADAAERFLRGQGIADDRVTTVWQSIALHTSNGMAERFGAVQGLAYAGISIDVVGQGVEAFSPGFTDRVNAEWPRHDLGYALVDAIAETTLADPAKAPPFTFPAHIHAVVTGSAVDFLDVLANGVWKDQPRRSYPGR